MAVTIKQRFIHMAPRKLRLVADTVRGQSLEQAYARLLVMPKAAAKPVLHAIKSAANAAKTQNVTGNLHIQSIFVDEGPALKRRILKSRGRATRMEHRMSHVTVVVDAGPSLVAQKAAAKKANVKTKATKTQPKTDGKKES